jgi:hypothetical protein
MAVFMSFWNFMGIYNKNVSASIQEYGKKPITISISDSSTKAKKNGYRVIQYPFRFYDLN